MMDETRDDRIEIVGHDRNDEKLSTADLVTPGVNRRSFLGARQRQQEPDAPPNTSQALDAADALETGVPKGWVTAEQKGAPVVMVRQKTTVETEECAPLFSAAEAADFRARWDKIQVRFIDEPQRCVERADGLVAETMQRLAETFAKEREDLEHQWDRGGDISTEDLRLALRRYRSFFGRLIQV